jgi:hypothetical protein
MEDDLYERRPQWKTTTVEDDLHGWKLQWKTNSVVDELSGRWPLWKTTSVEDDLSGRRPQWKRTAVEDDLSGRRPQWKTTSVEDNLSGKGPQWKMTLLAWNQQNILRSTLAESEFFWKDGRRPPWKKTSILAQPQQSSKLETKLGTAQPQLVSILSLFALTCLARQMWCDFCPSYFSPRKDCPSGLWQELWSENFPKWYLPPRGVPSSALVGKFNWNWAEGSFIITVNTVRPHPTRPE